MGKKYSSYQCWKQWMNLMNRMFKICNAKPAEGALTQILTVLHSLCFSSHFLSVAFISMLAFWACVKYCQYSCLTKRFSSILFAYSMYDSACWPDYEHSRFPPSALAAWLTLFVFGPFACLLVFVYWINPVHVDGSDCYAGIDPLPEFTFLSA